MYTTLYKLFRAPRTRHLKRKTWIAHTIWNYFLGWQRTRYALGLSYMSFYEMSREFTVLKHSHPEIFSHWRELNTWSAREILKRLDEGYQRFFSGLAKRPPKFRSWRKPYSFTMCQSGFKFADPEEGDLGFGVYNDKVRIMKRDYRFNLSRPILGSIKTVTVKADALGDFYMSVVTDHIATEVAPKTGEAAGYDFGMKTMFTCSDGTQRESPAFYSTAQSKLKSAQQRQSSKVKGSNNRERERKNVARVHRKIRRQRENHHWKLAKRLVHQHDILCFETLTFEGMKRLWGRKVSDIAPYAFHQKLRHQSKKHDKRLCYIDRFEPTSRTCSQCGQLNMFITLDVREWKCSGCKRQHHRDVNIAVFCFGLLRCGNACSVLGIALLLNIAVSKRVASSRRIATAGSGKSEPATPHAGKERNYRDRHATSPPGTSERPRCLVRFLLVTTVTRSPNNKFDWCKELSQNASKNAIHNFGDAVTRWKKGQNKFPVYKNRSGKCSYQADNGEGTVEVYKKRINLPKIGWVRMREELRYSGEITKVVISKYNNKWFVSITVRRLDSSNYKHQPALFDDTKVPIGIDVGINTLATCSNGDTYDNPRPLKRYLRKLARANRRLSRRQKGSQNWYKAKRLLTGVHARIANLRSDAHHQATIRIVRKASAIGIETLNISGMLKNRKIAKALSDSALGGFLTKLKYKANRRGIPIDEADQFNTFVRFL